MRNHVVSHEGWLKALESGSVPMIASQRETAGACTGSENPTALGATGWLGLAASPTFALMALTGVLGSGPLDMLSSPTFALMALLTGVLGGGPLDIVCSAAHGPLGGMVPMYLLMSAFHSAPWLKLISSWRSGAIRS